LKDRGKVVSGGRRVSVRRFEKVHRKRSLEDIVLKNPKGTKGGKREGDM